MAAGKLALGATWLDRAGAGGRVGGARQAVAVPRGGGRTRALSRAARRRRGRDGGAGAAGAQAAAAGAADADRAARSRGGAALRRQRRRRDRRRRDRRAVDADGGGGAQLPAAHPARQGRRVRQGRAGGGRGGRQAADERIGRGRWRRAAPGGGRPARVASRARARRSRASRWRSSTRSRTSCRRATPWRARRPPREDASPRAKLHDAPTQRLADVEGLLQLGRARGRARADVGGGAGGDGRARGDGAGGAAARDRCGSIATRCAARRRRSAEHGPLLGGAGSGSGRRRARPLLLRLGDPSLEVRYYATLALGALRSSDVVAPLGTRLLRPDASVRRAAIEALAQFPDSPELRALVEQLRGELPGPDGAAAAVRGRGARRHARRDVGAAAHRAGQAQRPGGGVGGAQGARRGHQAGLRHVALALAQLVGAASRSAARGVDARGAGARGGRGAAVGVRGAARGVAARSSATPSTGRSASAKSRARSGSIGCARTRPSSKTAGRLGAVA